MYEEELPKFISSSYTFAAFHVAIFGMDFLGRFILMVFQFQLDYLHRAAPSPRLSFVHCSLLVTVIV